MSECTYRIRKDNLLLREMLVFSGWNFIGATSGILKRQGNNLVVNLFFGTVVNAAYGLNDANDFCYIKFFDWLFECYKPANN